jgi:xanthine dehydrogenase YagR molybdenum-binding subunit
MTIDNNKAMENVLPRPDVRQKVTGAAKYSNDQMLPGMLWARYVRFPFGLGRVVESNVGAARAVKGVVSISLNRDPKGEYPGDRIGEVIAESKEALDDAIAALGLKFAYDPPNSRPERLYKGVPEPTGEDAAKARRLEELYGQAKAVVEATYTTQVQTHLCLEPHGSTVNFKAAGGSEAWVSTQSVVAAHEGMTKALDVPAAELTVKCEFVGGGFGSKFGIGPEGSLAAKASKGNNRPARVFLDRREEHADGGNRPGSIQYMKLAVDGNGRLLGGRVHLANTVGFRDGRGGIRNPNYYNFGEVVRTEESLSLNGGLPAAFRAPGYPQGAFAYESMLDELAAAIGMDPVQIRIVNETSDRRRKQLRMGAELIGWKDRQPDGAQRGIVRVGYGCGVSSWGNGPGRCSCDVDIHRSGDMEVRVGIQDIGTGANVLPVDIVAYRLGIPRSRVTSKMGNSNYPPGPGSGGSVTSRFTAPAIIDGAEKALAELKQIVAREWKVGADRVEYAAGTFSEAGGSRRLAWNQACSLMPADRISVRGNFNDAYWGNGNSDSVQFVKVEVDTETGIVVVKKVVAIHACGKPVNRLTTENQIHGGVIQGISYALFEDRKLDPVTGAHLNPDMLFYKIAGSRDVPEIVPVIDVEDGEDGVRALGEPTTIPTAGAIANAVANATGARVRDLPITPRRVLEAIDRKQGGTA